MIPLSRPFLDNSEREAIARVLESGWLAHGELNGEFESLFADIIGVRHAVSLNSCTSALHLAIEALGITGEVLVPSFTFVASANAIVTAGATPVFVDIEPHTNNMDPRGILKNMSDRTQAIMPVHYGGHPCDMDRIMAIADEHDLKVIEDAAETIGGQVGERVAGGIGDCGCFSFFPTKNMTTGEGGMLVTDDGDLASTVRTLSAHGIATSTAEREKVDKPWYRAASMPGYNFRMCQVLAAIGVEQLGKLETMNCRRREIAAELNQRLDAELLGLPVEHPGYHHVYQMYTVKVEPEVRNWFVLALRERGVAASVHFDPPVHRQPYYRERMGGVELPVTERVANSIATLPMFPHMDSKQVDELVEVVNACVRKIAAGGGAGVRDPDVSR